MSSTTAMIGPKGRSATGASVLANRHKPITSEMAAASPANESIHSFVSNKMPGTTIIVAMNKKKRIVEPRDDIQKVHKRTLRRLDIHTFLKEYNCQPAMQRPGEI